MPQGPSSDRSFLDRASAPLIPAWGNRGAFIALFLLIGLIYCNSLPAIWTIDDGPNILENPRVQIRNLSVSSLYGSMFSPLHPGVDGAPGLNRPLAHLSFALNWYLGQDSPIGYRAVNVGIHALTACVLFLLVRALLQSPNMAARFQGDAAPVALMSAALWAANPIQTQAVVYIVQRMASLACLFYLLAMWCYLQARTSTSRRATVFVLLTCACFAAALASKENAVLLPAAIVLMEFTFYRDLSQARVRRRLWVVVTGVGALVLLAGACVFIDGSLLGVLNYGNRLFTPAERLLTEPRVVLFYLSQIFWPAPGRLSLVHDVEWSRGLLDPWTTLPAVLGIAGLVVLGLSQVRKRPMLSFAVLFFLLNHVIESSLIGLELVYEHRNYLPSLFLFVPVALALRALAGKLRQKSPAAHALAAVFGALLVVGWGAGTFVRNLTWLDHKAFWEDAAGKAPLSMRPVHNLAYYHYERRGDYEKAFELYTRALQLRDENRVTLTFPHIKIADYYERKGDLEKTGEHLEHALRIYPGFEKVRLRQAQVLTRAGHAERALDVLQPLLERHPDSLDCNFLQAQILITMGRPADALRPLAVCMERSPEPKVFLLTGIALSLKGDFSEAERFLRAVLERFPTDLLTQLWLIACTLQREATGAATEYRARFLAGVPPDRVAEAIDKALTDGFMPDGTREHITRWIVNAASKHAESSKS